MFTNIMTGPTAIDVAGVSALGQALVYHEDEDARRSDKWNREPAQRLEAESLSIAWRMGLPPESPCAVPRTDRRPASAWAELWLPCSLSVWLLRPSLSSVSGCSGGTARHLSVRRGYCKF